MINFTVGPVQSTEKVKLIGLKMFLILERQSFRLLCWRMKDLCGSLPVLMKQQE